MARIVLTAVGSGGDVYPLIPIRDELAQRGHEAVLALPPAHVHLLDDGQRELLPIGPFQARAAARRAQTFETGRSAARGVDGFWTLVLEGLERTVADLRRGRRRGRSRAGPRLPPRGADRDGRRGHPSGGPRSAPGLPPLEPTANPGRRLVGAREPGRVVAAAAPVGATRRSGGEPRAVRGGPAAHDGSRPPGRPRRPAPLRSRRALVRPGRASRPGRRRGGGLPLLGSTHQARGRRTCRRLGPPGRRPSRRVHTRHRGHPGPGLVLRGDHGRPRTRPAPRPRARRPRPPARAARSDGGASVRAPLGRAPPRGRGGASRGSGHDPSPRCATVARRSRSRGPSTSRTTRRDWSPSTPDEHCPGPSSRPAPWRPSCERCSTTAPVGPALGTPPRASRAPPRPPTSWPTPSTS